jgi:hypothetical protein
MAVVALYFWVLTAYCMFLSAEHKLNILIDRIDVLMVPIVCGCNLAVGISAREHSFALSVPSESRGLNQFSVSDIARLPMDTHVPCVLHTSSTRCPATANPVTW